MRLLAPFLIIAVGSAGIPGCTNDDPDQPPLNSISASSKEEMTVVKKKGSRPAIPSSK